MKNGFIKVPINVVWEIINKPHRMFQFLRDEVDNLPLGEYYLLNFNLETKEELVKKFNNIANTGVIIDYKK